MKTIVIVTGANGFLGNNIVRKLEKLDVEVRSLVLPLDDTSNLSKLNTSIYRGDVTDKKSLEEIFNVPRNCILYVIHCAAIVNIKKKYNKSVYDVNVIGTQNIVEKVLEHNGKLVYVNSVHAIKEKRLFKTMVEVKTFNPKYVVGQYAKTKAIAAKYVLNMVKEHNLNACIVHPSGIIGPNDYNNTHLTELIRKIGNKSLRIIVKGGYNLVDVRDVAGAIINACKLDNKGECYILSNKYVTIKELADIITKIKKIDKVKLVLPIWLVKPISMICELYYNMTKRTPLFTSYSLYTLKSNSNFSNKKAVSKLNFKPRKIETSVRDTINFLNKNNKN